MTAVLSLPPSLAEIDGASVTIEQVDELIKDAEAALRHLRELRAMLARPGN